MKQGDLYRHPDTGWTVLVASRTSFNETDYPYITGICCELKDDAEHEFPFEVPVFIADDRAWAQTMTIGPWRKADLEPIGRSLDREDMLSVLDALLQILGSTPSKPDESRPDHPM